VVLFNDELALLDIRIDLLESVVDHVVVVEGTRTFTGAPKPLHFADRVQPPKTTAQIHHVTVELPADASTAWERERVQRAAMRQFLENHAADDDLVLIGDLDELPRPDVVSRLTRTLDGPTRLEMVDSLYFANWVQPRPWMIGTMATRRSGFDHPTVREMFGDPPSDDECFVEEVVPAAGWHVSFLGGVDALIKKLGDYSHQELNTVINRRREFLEACVRYGAHFAGWTPLRKLGRGELPPPVEELSERHPVLFDFSAPPRRAASLTWCGWAWIRGRAPTSVSARLDAHPRAVFVLLGWCLLPLQCARQARRRWERLPRTPAGKEFVRSQA